jgi:hypothetical protein
MLHKPLQNYNKMFKNPNKLQLFFLSKQKDAFVLPQRRPKYQFSAPKTEQSTSDQKVYVSEQSNWWRLSLTVTALQSFDLGSG